MLGEGNSRDRDLLIHFDILRKVFGGVLRPANEEDLVDHCTTTVFRVDTAAQTRDAYAQGNPKKTIGIQSNNGLVISGP